MEECIILLVLLLTFRWRFYALSAVPWTEPFGWRATAFLTTYTGQQPALLCMSFTIRNHFGSRHESARSTIRAFAHDKVRECLYTMLQRAALATLNADAEPKF